MSIVKLWRVKGVKGGFTTFFIFILALRCLSQNVGTFQVKRLSVLVKTLRCFCVDDELVWFFHFYFIAIVHDLFVIPLYHPKIDSGNSNTKSRWKHRFPSPLNSKNKAINIVLTFKLLKIMKMEMNYVAPELEVLEVMVEKGFEGSVTPPGVGEEL